MKPIIRKLIQWLAVLFFLGLAIGAFAENTPVGGILCLLAVVVLLPIQKMNELWEKLPRGKRVIKFGLCIVALFTVALTGTPNASAHVTGAVANATPVATTVTRNDSTTAPKASATPTPSVASTSTPKVTSTPTPTPKPTPTPTPTPVATSTPAPTPTPDDCGWVSDSSYIKGGYCSYHPEWYSEADKVQPQEQTYTDTSQQGAAGGTGNGDNFNTYNNPYSGPAPYVGNSNTFKFHYAGCGSVAKMNASNRVEFYSRDDAVNAGYQPCKRCNP